MKEVNNWFYILLKTKNQIMLLPKKVLIFIIRRVLTKVEYIKSLNQAFKKPLMNNIKLLYKYLQKSKNTVNFMYGDGQIDVDTDGVNVISIKN